MCLIYQFISSVCMHLFGRWCHDRHIWFQIYFCLRCHKTGLQIHVAVRNVNESRSRQVSKFFLALENYKYPKMTLGHTSALHYMLWTTRCVWLRDREWPAGHPGKDSGNCLWSSMSWVACYWHRLLWRIVRLLKALLSCSRVHCLVHWHQWPSFTVLQPRPI